MSRNRRARRTFQQKAKAAARKRDIRSILGSAGAVSTGSITSTILDVAPLFKCYDVEDKSASEGFQLRKGNPFDRLTSLITETKNHNRDYSESYTKIGRNKSRPAPKSGPVNHIMENGKLLDKGDSK